MAEEKRVIGYHLNLIGERAWKNSLNYDSEGKLPPGLLPVSDLHSIQNKIQTDKSYWVESFAVPTSSGVRLYSDSRLYSYTDRNGVNARFLLPLQGIPYASKIRLFSTNPGLIRTSLEESLGIISNGFQLREGNPF